MADIKISFSKTLDQLKQLQNIFNQKFEIERNIVELPQEVELKSEMVLRLKEKYLVQNKQFSELQTQVTQKRLELETLQANREKYEREIAQVNSQRDYEQIDRAIKENLEQEQIMRSEYTALESRQKLFSEEFAQSEDLLKNQEQSLNELKTSIENRIKELESSLKVIKKQEDKITAGLDDKLVFKFERIIRSTEGDGIVAVRQNVCCGCNMILPLQFVSGVRKETEVHNCPYCSKILFYDDVYEEEILEEETSGLQDLYEDTDIELDNFDREDFELFLEDDAIGSDEYRVDADLDEDDESDDNLDDDDDDLDDDDIDDDDGGLENEYDDTEDLDIEPKDEMLESDMEGDDLSHL